MRGVSKRGLRPIAVLTLLALLAAPNAVAASRDGDVGGKFFERAKRYVISVLSRLGTPPG